MTHDPSPVSPAADPAAPVISLQDVGVRFSRKRRDLSLRAALFRRSC